MSSASAFTHTEHVSGPSPLVAVLRALYLKVTGVIHSAWSTARVVLSTSLRLPGTVAAAVTSVLSSKTGYASTTRGIRGLFSGIWRAITGCARFVSRIIGATAKALVTLVGYASPRAADVLYAAFSQVRVNVAAIATRVDTFVRTVGEVLWMLLNTSMVRTVSTTVAGVAAGLLVVHEATSGAVAAWIVGQIPALLKVVGWVTNPWISLAAVGLSTLGAMGLAFLRLLNAGQDAASGPDDDGPDDPADASDWTRWQASIDEQALESLVGGLHVSVAPDGSVSVSGIPEWVPANLRNHLAKVAADAALKQWERTIRRRPQPNRDDRRLFTKAARDAVRDYASGPRTGTRQAA